VHPSSRLCRPLPPCSSGSVVGSFSRLQTSDLITNLLPEGIPDVFAKFPTLELGIPDAALPSVFPNFPNFGSKKLGFLG